MKKPNLLALFSLTVLMTVLGCSDGDKKYFDFDPDKVKDQYEPAESVALSIRNADGKSIDSIVYIVNDKKIGSKKGGDPMQFNLKGQKLGYQNLLAKVYFDGSRFEQVEKRIEVISDVTPKMYSYKIVNTYPHDEKAFTQGLEFYRDTLIESTGQKGASYLRKFDYKTGFAYKQVNMEPEFFGEGITVIGGKIFQLTWQDMTGFIYDANTLRQEKTFRYDHKVEGWGMTNNGTHIYFSDGTEKLWILDPATQKIVDYVNVYTGGTKITSINELEWINGKIYGNIWQKDVIAVIDPATGAVHGAVDLSALRKQVSSTNAEVLNGIAYNPKTRTIFVTGKYWDKMFEITVSE